MKHLILSCLFFFIGLIFTAEAKTFVPDVVDKEGNLSAACLMEIFDGYVYKLNLVKIKNKTYTITFANKINDHQLFGTWKNISNHVSSSYAKNEELIQYKKMVALVTWLGSDIFLSTSEVSRKEFNRLVKNSDAKYLKVALDKISSDEHVPDILVHVDSLTTERAMFPSINCTKWVEKGKKMANYTLTLGDVKLFFILRLTIPKSASKKKMSTPSKHSKKKVGRKKRNRITKKTKRRDFNHPEYPPIRHVSKLDHK